jgi:hypothetical protein
MQGPAMHGSRGMIALLHKCEDVHAYPPMKEIIQEKYHAQLFGVLIPALEAPESRYVVSTPHGRSHLVGDDWWIGYTPMPLRLLSTFARAWSATRSFRTLTLSWSVCLSYSTPRWSLGRRWLVSFRILRYDDDNAGQVRRYVQEQAVTTLAMVADASEVTFAKVRAFLCGLAVTWD